MRRAALLALLPLAACAGIRPADTAQLPPNAFSPLDQDIPAVNYAGYAFAAPSRTAGNPAAGAQAVLAMDYVAGEWNTSPRWQFVAATTQLQLLQGRRATRDAVGIAPDAPSQVVVNQLVTARDALEHGDQATARQALSNPVFTRGPDATIATLTNLPYIQMANVSTSKAVQQEQPNDRGSDWR